MYLNIRDPWHMFCFYFHHCKWKHYSTERLGDYPSTRSSFSATCIKKKWNHLVSRRGKCWKKNRSEIKKLSTELFQCSFSLSTAILKIKIGIKSSFSRAKICKNGKYNIQEERKLLHAMQTRGKKTTKAEKNGFIRYLFLICLI